MWCASLARRRYAFIPDAKIVGTVFVNCVANAVATHTQNATLHLVPRGGATFAGDVVGRAAGAVTDASWGRVVELGTLTLGGSRDVVVPMRLPAGAATYLEATVTFPDPRGGGGGGAAASSTGEASEAHATLDGASRAASRDATAALARASVVRAVFSAVKDADANRGQKANRDMAALVRKVAALEAESDGDARVVALKADVDGRLLKARRFWQGRPRVSGRRFERERLSFDRRRRGPQV